MNNDANDELRTLNPAQWEELVAALLQYAKKQVAVRKWAGSNPLGTGAECEEFVYRVVEKVIAGDRPWSRTDAHTLRQHLFMCVRSEVENLAHRKDNSDRDELDKKIANGKANPGRVSPPTPEELLMEKQQALRIERILYEVAPEDPLLQKLVDLFLDGYDSPTEMATTLNISVDQINVALKKLRRRLKKQDASANITRAT